MKTTEGRSRRPFTRGKAALWCLVPLLAALYLASGCFVVKPEQRGVVTRFGRVVDDNVLPGIHYHWPWPVESVALVATTEIRSMAVSFGSDKEPPRVKLERTGL